MKILVCCGSGLGSSFMIEMNIKKALQEIGVEEQPVVPLYFDENIVVYNAARLTGYRALRYGVSLAEVAWR